MELPRHRDLFHHHTLGSEHFDETVHGCGTNIPELLKEEEQVVAAFAMGNVFELKRPLFQQV